MMSATIIKEPAGEPAGPWNDLGIFVLSEGSARGREVCSLLDRLGGSTAWWSFKTLASPHLRKLAAGEAARADLIIMAAHEGPTLPEPVMDFLSLWLAMRECYPQALVALLDSDPRANGASRQILAQLKMVAEMGGLDFFTRGPNEQLEEALSCGGAAVVREQRRGPGATPPSGSNAAVREQRRRPGATPPS